MVTKAEGIIPTVHVVVMGTESIEPVLAKIPWDRPVTSRDAVPFAVIDFKGPKLEQTIRVELNRTSPRPDVPGEGHIGYHPTIYVSDGTRYDGPDRPRLGAEYAKTLVWGLFRVESPVRLMMEQLDDVREVLAEQAAKEKAIRTRLDRTLASIRNTAAQVDVIARNAAE